MGLQIIPYDLNINFVGLRRISYAVSLLLILVGMGVLVYQGGPKYGIDFAGGATAIVRFAEPLDDGRVKDSLAGADLPGLTVQQFGEDGTTYQLRIATVEETSTGINAAVQQALATHLPDVGFSIERLEMVGPKVGADLRAKALEAMYFAILITAIYISGRFEYRWFTAAIMAAALMGSMYGLGYLGLGKEYLVLAAVIVTVLLCWRLKLVFALGTIVSILHDVLITVGIFAMLGKEFDLTIIAALLTVVGYSLNDTIIVYDRIRENLRDNVDTPLSALINRSINQTLSRTVLTSGSTLIVIIALLIWGGGIIHDFALVMCIGVVVGTLSSMFVASPVLLVFGDSVVSHRDKKDDRRPRDQDGRIAAQV